MPANRPNGELNPETSAAVLVVDDEDSVRNLIARWLTHEGYSCAQAGDAQSAWEHLQTHEVHLVTLDIRMAGPSGIDLLHRINEVYPDTAIIMMTAVEETQTAVEALTHGACAYLGKPVEREELIFHAHKALERRQVMVEKRNYTFQLEQRVREQTLAIRRAHEETIYRLVSASLWRDEETGTHIKRVGLLSEALARAAGWSATESETIRLAAPMHDVGKIGIPDAILCKPGKLSPAEFEIMKTHTIIGANMLAGSGVPMLRMAQEIALGHHERWDGEGYPGRRAGETVPESARIVAIVDVYDALTHDRVYRRALTEEEALDIIRRGGAGQFDPLLLSLFFANISDISRIAHENPDEPAVGDAIDGCFPGVLLTPAVPQPAAPVAQVM